MRGRSVIEINTLGTLALLAAVGVWSQGISHPIPPWQAEEFGHGEGACRSLVLKTNLGPVIHKSLVYQCLETLICTSTNQEAHHFHLKTAFISGVVITDNGTIGPLNLEVAGSTMQVIILKVTQKLHKCNTALLFLPVLN